MLLNIERLSQSSNSLQVIKIHTPKHSDDVQLCQYILLANNYLVLEIHNMHEYFVIMLRLKTNIS